MDRLKLIRKRRNGDGTFGEFLWRGLHYAVSVERPWMNNQNDISCIPVGVYLVTKFDSPHNGPCFLLHGTEPRDMIEIHSANVAKQLKGCIAPGKTFAKFPQFDGAEGVTFSHDTLEQMLEDLPDTFEIEITEELVA